jgi:hypothetical protein
LKYQLAPRFRHEYWLLNERERSLFRNAILEINAARARNPSIWPPQWPTRLRMKPLRGVPGVREMTWSFTGPDGRATFEFVTIEGEPGIF